MGKSKKSNKPQKKKPLNSGIVRNRNEAEQALPKIAVTASAPAKAQKVQETAPQVAVKAGPVKAPKMTEAVTVQAPPAQVAAPAKPARATPIKTPTAASTGLRGIIVGHRMADSGNGGKLLYTKILTQKETGAWEEITHFKPEIKRNLLTQVVFEVYDYKGSPSACNVETISEAAPQLAVLANAPQIERMFVSQAVQLLTEGKPLPGTILGIYENQVYVNKRD